ncbi:type III-B CRISPR module-associated protein Cmr5 [uncultured Victivallis sp.]|uniref:type III-B CRISPR module-associated protein Cmr5 n=1 Tax=uncultured Victivallis sp. TaxID=354118 RepID=UPI0025D7E74B|nr:type III-B CRISPR module-associated protein Cmr5 [uncultured Victivallis sp.]
MKNLDQIRAANAIEAARKKMGAKEKGEVVKKIPTMIRDNGILGALAFAREAGEGYADCFAAIITHLRSVKASRADGIDSFLKELTEADSGEMRRITSEAMAYLNYLRRFAEKPEKGEGGK